MGSVLSEGCVHRQVAVALAVQLGNLLLSDPLSCLDLLLTLEVLSLYTAHQPLRQDRSAERARYTDYRRSQSAGCLRNAVK